MCSKDLDSIFEHIDKLVISDGKKEENVDYPEDTLQEVLQEVIEEIQRVLQENDLTQEDLCKITNMSQSNISKIQNGRVVPRIETLHKIAMATHTRLIISFENIEGDLR